MVVKQRLEYIDLIKTLAIFAIITLHIFQVWKQGQQVMGIDIYALAAITRFGVPIFIMVSGALLLNKDIEIPSFLKRRVTRIVYPFIFCYFVCCVVTLINTGTIQFPNLFSFRWYFWLILGVYLSVPIINKFIQHASMREIEYFILIFVLAGIHYQLTHYFAIEQYLDLSMFISPLGYLVLGYYLSKKDFNMSSNRILAISVLVFAVITLIKVGGRTGIIPLTENFTALNTNMLSSWLDVSLVEIIQSASVFLICKNIYECSDGIFLPIKRLLKSNIVEKSVTSISRSSYGMYLFNFLPTEFLHATVKHMKLTGTGICLSILVLSVVIFIGSWLVIALLGRIPYIKYVSGYY